jgi:hypothetical protein
MMTTSEVVSQPGAGARRRRGSAAYPCGSIDLSSSLVRPNLAAPPDGATLRRLIDEAGFDLVARRRDLPHASVERLLFVLLSHVSHGVRDGFFRRVHFLNRLVVPVRAPDAYEYVCVKR